MQPKPQKVCANCKRRPPVDGNHCRHCIANAAVARKRRANSRAKALRDWQRPLVVQARTPMQPAGYCEQCGDQWADGHKCQHGR